MLLESHLYDPFHFHVKYLVSWVHWSDNSHELNVSIFLIISQTKLGKCFLKAALADFLAVQGAVE